MLPMLSRLGLGVLLVLVVAAVARAESKLLPELQQITAAPGEISLTSATIIVDDAATGRQLTGPEMLADRLEKITGHRPAIVKAGEVPPAAGVIVVGERGKNSALVQEPAAAALDGLEMVTAAEGYAMAITPEVVAIVGADEAGSFYGCMTLLQLIQDEGPVRCQRIRDWPDMPIRGVCNIPPPGIPYLAQMKINLVALYESWYNLEDAKVGARIKATAEECRNHFINLTPTFGSWSHTPEVLRRDPYTAEGMVVTEELELTDQWQHLKYRNVVDLPNCPILVSSADGKTQFDRDADFAIQPGEFEYGYSADNEPWQIRRLPAGRIAEGQLVKVRYNYIPPESTDYCISEPRTYVIMKRIIQDIVRLLHPRYIHIGHDEAVRFGTDFRDLLRGKTPAELLAEDITRLNDYAHEVDPDVQLMMWADQVNPYHERTDACQFYLNQPLSVVNLLPKDVIQCVWIYSDAEPRVYPSGSVAIQVETKSIDHFTRYGLPTVGCPWFNPLNAYQWAEAVAKGRAESELVQGILCTTWGAKKDEPFDPFGGLETTAQYTWKATASRPVWLGGLNTYFMSNIAYPTVTELHAEMARDLNGVVRRNASVDEEVQRFMNALRAAAGGAPDADTGASALQARRAYERLMLGVQAERDDYEGNRNRAATNLRQLEHLGQHLFSEDQSEAVSQSVADYAAGGQFPSAQDLLGVELARQRPGKEYQGWVLPIPNLSTSSPTPGTVRVDLGFPYPRIVRLEFEAQNLGELEVKASVDGEKFKSITTVQGQPLTGPVLLPETPARYLELVASPWQSEAASINSLRVYEHKLSTVLVCPEVSNPPEIDGRLDDEVWSQAAVADDFVSCFRPYNQLVPHQVQAYLLRCGDCLYVGWRAQEPNTDRLVTGHFTEDLPRYYNEDCFSLFIKPQWSADEYITLSVNSKGDTLSNHWRSVGWKPPGPPWKAAAETGQGVWTAEMQIPLTTLLADTFAGTWGVNFLQGFYKGPAWNCTYGGVVSFGAGAAPFFYGKLTFR